MIRILDDFGLSLKTFFTSWQKHEAAGGPMSELCFRYHGICISWSAFLGHYTLWRLPLCVRLWASLLVMAWSFLMWYWNGLSLVLHLSAPGHCLLRCFPCQPQRVFRAYWGTWDTHCSGWHMGWTSRSIGQLAKCSSVYWTNFSFVLVCCGNDCRKPVFLGEPRFSPQKRWDLWMFDSSHSSPQNI